MSDEKRNISEKELVKRLYLNTIIGKKSKLLRGNLEQSEYRDWINAMAKNLLELNFSVREMSFIVQQAEDHANSSMIGKNPNRKKNQLKK